MSSLYSSKASSSSFKLYFARPKVWYQYYMYLCCKITKADSVNNNII